MALVLPGAAPLGAQVVVVGRERERAVGVILPLDPAEDASTPSKDADARPAWDAFLRAGRRLERRFRPGVSGVRLLSAMRR